MSKSRERGLTNIGNYNEKQKKNTFFTFVFYYTLRSNIGVYINARRVNKNTQTFNIYNRKK